MTRDRDGAAASLLAGPDARVPWAAAVLVLGAALLHAGLEQLTGGPDLGGVLRWRLFPATLWAFAAPLAVLAGARWPPLGGYGEGGRSPRASGRRRLAAVAAWAAGFAAWHLAVNVAIRLPELPARGGAWLWTDSLAGWVEYAPAALSLFALLVLAGGRLRPRPVPPASSPSPQGPAGPEPPTALALPGPNRVHRVPPREIRWLEADGDHVRVHGERRSYRVRTTLRELEARLASTGRFVRIHRSSLVDAARVREVQPLRHGDWVAVLDDGTELRIPRTRRRALDRLRGRGGEPAAER